MICGLLLSCPSAVIRDDFGRRRLTLHRWESVGDRFFYNVNVIDFLFVPLGFYGR
mgnify:CR=1 FL=1